MYISGHSHDHDGDGVNSCLSRCTHATRTKTGAIFFRNETSSGGPNLIPRVKKSFRFDSLEGREKNGDEYKNGVGLGSASGICGRVYDRLQFLYRVDRYLARLDGLLAGAGNHSPRKYNPGATDSICQVIPNDRIIYYLCS